MTWPPRSICSCISHRRVPRTPPSASTPNGSPESGKPSPRNTPSPTAASNPERVPLPTLVLAHMTYNAGMNRLASAPQMNRLADLVRLASTAGDHAKFPCATNAPPPSTTLTFACRRRRRHSNTTVQNQPELTKINHPKRTISSAQQYFSPNARENSSGAEQQTAGVTGPQVAPSADLQRRRAGSNAIERNRTPNRTISSAQRHFRRNTPENLCAPNAPNRRRQPTTSCLRAE